MNRRWQHILGRLHENNGLQRWVCRKMIGMTQRFGISVCGNHFDEPIPDIRNIASNYDENPRALHWFCPALRWEANASEILCGYLQEYVESSTYARYNRNWFYDGWDAAYYYCFIRTTKPQRITEIGQGVSTEIAQAAMDLNLRDGHGGSIISVDPYARGVESSRCTTIRRQRLEDIDDEDCSELLRTDVLFIDSTHVVKWNSDVTRLLQTWIPEVPIHTAVHIHDIFTPYDYPKKWMVDAKRFWNEQYLVEAFLSFNSSFTVECPIHYLWRTGGLQRVAKQIGVADEVKPSGAAFWLRRTT